MKHLPAIYSPLKPALVFVLFVALVFGLSAVLGYQTLGGYVAPLVLLLLTWVLYRSEGKDLSALGLQPAVRTGLFLPLGLIIGILFLSGALFLQTLHDNTTITANPNADYLKAACGVFLLLQGVLNEELIFRGFCLQKTTRLMGAVKANLLFALLFMVWHWISWNAWGNYELMLASVTTGFGHWLFAVAFSLSRTLYFPIGLHLGVNWASYNLFAMNGASNRTDAMLVVSQAQTSGTAHLLVNILLTLACYAVVIGVLWKWRKKEPTENNPMDQ